MKSALRRLINEFNLLPRIFLARKHIRGEGIEIGAQSSPLRVPGRARVKYLDLIGREEIIRQFPHLDPGKVVNVDYLSDGFTLSGIEDGKFDFVIANHVLEHSANPIATLMNWFRVLKPGGTLFCSVPLKDRSFDRDRPLTGWQHFYEDYLAYESRDEELIRMRNARHYEEWLDFAEPAILKRPAISGLERERRLARMSDEKEEIHFHTFNKTSMEELLKNFDRSMGIPLEIVSLLETRVEIICIVKKKGTGRN